MGVLSIFADSFLGSFGPGFLLSREQPTRPGTEQGLFAYDASTAEMFYMPDENESAEAAPVARLGADADVQYVDIDPSEVFLQSAEVSSSVVQEFSDAVRRGMQFCPTREISGHVIPELAPGMSASQVVKLKVGDLTFDVIFVFFRGSEDSSSYPGGGVIPVIQTYLKRGR